MSQEVHYCLGGCSREIPFEEVLCPSCEVEYGSEKSAWPKWLIQQRHEELRIRRKDEDNRSTHQCMAGCGKRITYQFAICSSCEQIYGNKIEKWPGWLSFLWRDEMRIRRDTARINQKEVSFSDLDSNLEE